MQTFKQEDFWQFSLSVYEKGENKESFLCLQDTCNLNINLLLFAMYLADNAYLMTGEQFLMLNHSLTRLEEETNAFRLQRRKIGTSQKGSVEYKEALCKELASEKKQQESLINCVGKLGHLNVPMTKPSDKLIQEHLLMLFTALFKEKCTSYTAEVEEEFNRHTQTVISNYLLND